MARAFTTGKPNFHTDRDLNGETDGHLEPGMALELLEDAPVHAYWHVRLDDGREGFLHQDLVRVATEGVQDGPEAGDIEDWSFADTVIRQMAAESVFVYEGGLAIDADGAPNAYGPGDKGLDFLANAGEPGNWWALVTDDDGKPVMQGPNDPASGFYISTTALEDHDFAESDPRRYVDAGRVPFVVLPPAVRDRYGAALGDFAYVFNRGNGTACGAIFADIGPNTEIGEGSIALAASLGVASNPRAGGTDSGIVYLVFPGSGNGRPLPAAEVRAQAAQLFAAWGGMSKLQAFLT